VEKHIVKLGFLQVPAGPGQRPYRTVLQDNAIPTIFDLTSHLNNPHRIHRKRIKELSEDEFGTLKQKKSK
jgi:hypothetical protein